MNLTKYSNKIAKSAIIVFSGMVLGRILTYLYIALVARLGSSEYGLLSLGVAIVSFLSVFAILGLNAGIERYISFYKNKGDKKRIKGTIYSSIKLSLPLSVILAILLFIFSEKISVSIFHNIDLVPILRILCLTIPFLSLSNIFRSTIIGFQEIKYPVFIREVIENSVKLILTFILIYLGYNLFGAVISFVIAIMLTTILLLFSLQKKIFPLFTLKIKPKLITKELFSYSFPLLLVGFLVLMIKWTDVFMIGYFRTTSEVGLYNVALPTASLLVIVPTALMVLFMPIITELYTKGKMKDIHTLSRITLKWIFFVNFPIFLLILLFSKQILSILFGVEYIQASVALIILIMGYMIFSLSHVYMSNINMIKKTKLTFYILLIATLLNIALNYMLIPKFGMIGGGIATSVSLIALFILSSITTYRLTKLQPLRLNYFKAVFAGVISLFITYFIPVNINSVMTLLIKFIIFGIIYIIMLYLLKSFQQEDKDIFNLVFKRIKLIFKI